MILFTLGGIAVEVFSVNGAALEELGDKDCQGTSKKKKKKKDKILLKQDICPLNTFSKSFFILHHSLRFATILI